jgi:serine/threonine-protein kinase HipA
MAIERVLVSMDFGAKEFPVGELIQEGRTVYFKYDADFVAMGLEISPFHLPLKEEIFTAPHTPFEGLFGVFSDSLPDGWGRLLLDRALSAKGILAQDVTALERLCYVGMKGMGALLYRPEIKTVEQEFLPIELDSLSKEMDKVLEGSSSELLDELYHLGGSSGGARPKIVVGYHPETGKLIHGVDPLPEGYEHWLIKFPSSGDRSDGASIEYAYYKMALDAGISMSKCKLFETVSGKMFFGTKRFDRSPLGKLHLHSAAGILNDNFRYSSIDYGNLMDAAYRLEQSVSGHEKMLRLGAFNVFAHNRDDHSKNFSFLMDSKGSWCMSPAYDLTYSNSSHGMHSTTVAGEGTQPGSKQLLELANDFGMKNGRIIIDQVATAVNQWESYAREAGVTKESIQLIEKKMQNTLTL